MKQRWREQRRRGPNRCCGGDGTRERYVSDTGLRAYRLRFSAWSQNVAPLFSLPTAFFTISLWRLGPRAFSTFVALPLDFRSAAASAGATVRIKPGAWGRWYAERNTRGV